MSIGKTLEDFIDDGSNEIYPKQNQYNVDMGKLVRNAVYHSLDPSKKGKQMQDVLEQLLSHPKGISDYDIGKKLNLPRDRVGARRHDLKNLGVPIISFGFDMNYDTGKPNNKWGIKLKE